MNSLIMPRKNLYIKYIYANVFCGYSFTMSQKKRTFLKTIGSSVVGLGLVSGVGSAQQNKSNKGKSLDDVPANEIAFAKRNLPNFLENTILDGSKRVTVTESGDVPENFSSSDYDVIISKREFDKIEQEAIEEYKDKFNVDPANPQVEIIDGTPMHVDEVQRKVEAKEIDLSKGAPVTIDKPKADVKGENANNRLSYSGGSLENDGDYSIDLLRQGGSDQGPDSHDSTNELKVHVVPAYDSVHQPSEPYATKTYDALDIFADEFNVDVTHEIHIGYWTAASTGKDTYDIIDTLEYQDPFLNYDWEVVTGWVDEMNNNGVANRDGYYSVNACITNNGVDWDHERIVQHEISHNFDAPDRGTLGYEHEKCIMNYEYAYRGIDYWCSEDNYIVDVNINHED
jgi:hypothetical protein